MEERLDHLFSEVMIYSYDFLKIMLALEDPVTKGYLKPDDLAGSLKPIGERKIKQNCLVHRKWMFKAYDMQKEPPQGFQRVKLA